MHPVVKFVFLPVYHLPNHSNVIYENKLHIHIYILVRRTELVNLGLGIFHINPKSHTTRAVCNLELERQGAKMSISSKAKVYYIIKFRMLSSTPT